MSSTTTTTPATLPDSPSARSSQAKPVGIWQSWITFPDGSVQRSIIMYGQDGNVTESSTRYPARLCGLGQWRPVDERRFEAYFEKFMFDFGEDHASSWVRVQYAVSLDEAGTGYAGEARGIFMSLDREVRGSVPTTVRAERLPWALPER